MSETKGVETAPVFISCAIPRDKCLDKVEDHDTSYACDIQLVNFCPEY